MMPLVESDSIQIRFHRTRSQSHPFCFVCSAPNPTGLALGHTFQPDGSVTASFTGNCALEGYAGLLHGGVIAALLDGAMTNCLFAHGGVAMTGELNVRYREPVPLGEEMTVRAMIKESFFPLHLLTAELKQGSAVKATATAKFMERT